MERTSYRMRTPYGVLTGRGSIAVEHVYTAHAKLTLTLGDVVVELPVMGDKLDDLVDQLDACRRPTELAERATRLLEAAAS